MSPQDNGSREGWNRRLWLGSAACAWSIVFSAPHLYWATGGRAGLGAEAAAADAALSQPWFFTYNLLVGVLALVGAAVAIRLVRPTPGTWMLRAAAWSACVLLAVRGAVGITGLGLAFADGTMSSPALLVAIEPWFLIGGLLYGALAVTTG